MKGTRLMSLMLEIFRLAAAGNKGHRYDPERRGMRESRAVPAPDANAELVVSMQVIVLVTCPGMCEQPFCIYHDGRAHMFNRLNHGIEATRRFFCLS